MEALEEHGSGFCVLFIGNLPDYFFHSIPYVRFDGQMSAKRRQEAIARFSVPIAEEEPALQKANRKTRDKDGTAAQVIDVADDNDSDFAMNDDSDDFTDDGNDDGPIAGKKSKSHGKGKAKSVSRQSFGFEGSAENPRVMLLSLKAVCTFCATA